MSLQKSLPAIFLPSSLNHFLFFPFIHGQQQEFLVLSSRAGPAAFTLQKLLTSVKEMEQVLT